MTRSLFLIMTLLAGSLSSTVKGEEAVIYLSASEGEKIASREGQKITVHGISSQSAKSASGTNYVNFEDSKFHLVTFASDLGQFEDGEPHEIYNEKRIAIEGVISIYKGNPQIKLTSASQVRILAEDEVFPPIKAKPASTAKADPKEMKKGPLPPQKPVEEKAKPKPPVDSKKYFK